MRFWDTTTYVRKYWAQHEVNRPRGSGSVDKAPDSQWTNASSNPRGAHFWYYKYTISYHECFPDHHWTEKKTNEMKSMVLTWVVNTMSELRQIAYANRAAALQLISYTLTVFFSRGHGRLWTRLLKGPKQFKFYNGSKADLKIKFCWPGRA